MVTHLLIQWLNMAERSMTPVNLYIRIRLFLNALAASEVLQRLKQVSTARRSTSESVQSQSYFSVVITFKYRKKSRSTHLDITGSSHFVTWEVQ
jgi:hypothetical protein